MANRDKWGVRGGPLLVPPGLWAAYTYCVFPRLEPRPDDKPFYGIRYKGLVSPDKWTFAEATKMMRAIPRSEGLEVLLPDGQVNFTLPPNR